MTFHYPLWLLLLPLLLGLGCWWWRWFRRRLEQRLAAFVAVRIYAPLLAATVQARRRRRFWLSIGAVALLALALARPLAGVRATAAPAEGVNLLIALDGSRSMLTEDVAPNRFERARRAVDNLVTNLGGDRAGLLFFSGQTTFVAPLTFDRTSLQLVSRGLTTELVGKGGSSLSDVIGRAAEFFREQVHASRVLVLVSDGEETEGDAVVAAEAAFREHGLRIFTVGVGTAAGGPIPVFERNARREWVRTGNVRDEARNEVISRRDANVLRRIAAVAGGEYLELDESPADFSAWRERSLAPLAAPLETIELSDLHEWYRVPLVLALLLLVGEMWLRRTESRKAQSMAKPGWVTADRKGATLALGLLLGFVGGGTPTLRAGLPEAQALIEAGQAEDAFELLRDEYLEAPEDLRRRYNYALGAYAAERFTVAVENFAELAESMDFEIEPRSRAQLGNSLYRLGERMRLSNPEGTVVQWEKALAAYRSAPEIALAQTNHPLAREQLIVLLLEMATARTAEGDAAARMRPEEGVPAWREAVARLEQAEEIAESPARRTAIMERQQAVTARIYDAFMRVGADKRRRAEMQRRSMLERAIGLIEGAVGDFENALDARPRDEAATRALAEATALLNPWRVEWGDQLHEQGRAAQAVAPADAITFWERAGVQYARVLQEAPAHGPALAGKARNDRALHDGHVALGDRSLQQAERSGLDPTERDALLEDALGRYQTALSYLPDQTATQEKAQTLGRRLTEVFVARGDADLTQGKALATEDLPAAIASLERAVQSFARALGFVPDHAGARAGKIEAETLLRQLREEDAREQRKMEGEGEEMSDPQDIEDPGDLALKLLDFDNENLASKKQQNLSAPENRPVKDW
ncbi:VWA domain-containing protein [Actomonas aquatica]|uniref:VWA domain-containing protein n=1 Tax=Actomonas aquatica TaxID=2866162 RepID=A0ABZ1C2R3_9BACT|nr:VWA domain-containing protein [Opitutus sp. WL0086]WRQ85761.1 VWA domain-containing protein [Opitutus sp. WL0086]